MERLVTTSEAAQLLGLSLQGVHYRIKSGQLKSLKQGGKTFVYVTEFFQQKTEESIKNTSNSSLEHHTNERIETLVKSKDEQISLLKQSIGFIKEQYQNEIRRLEKNQKRIIKVFNSEIKLLQSAFNEMRSIYKPKLLASEQNNQKSNYCIMPKLRSQQFLMYLICQRLAFDRLYHSNKTRLRHALLRW